MAVYNESSAAVNHYSWHPVLQATALLRVFSFISGNRINGMALWPFVLVDTKRVASSTTEQSQYEYRIQRVIRHEVIHLKQWQECLILFFVPLYLLAWAVELAQSKSFRKAYTNNWFEREAYAHDWSISYQDNRPMYNWVRQKSSADA